MRNFLAKSIVLASTLILIPVTTVSATPDKVTMCQNGNTISVSSSAVTGLLNSGATLGPCSSTGVPEFGFATGAVAVFGAGVAYLALKKKYATSKVS